jgi:hypothetical protein
MTATSIGDLRAGAGVERVGAMLSGRHEELVEEALRRIRNEVPGYAVINDPDLLLDISVHVSENLDAWRACLLDGRPVTDADVDFVRPHAAERARFGISLADFLHAFRIGQRVVWDAIGDFAATDQEGRDIAVPIARSVLAFIDHASTHAAETYVMTQQLTVPGGDRVRRDLLEKLLAGREPAPGQELAIANGAGLRPGARWVLLVAVPVGGPIGDYPLRSAASAVARAAGGALRPLTVVLDDEIVIIRMLGSQDARSVAGPVRQSLRDLACEGVELAIGISTAFETRASVPDAYREACLALESLGSRGGVMSLPGLRVLDYLTLRGDATALRLVSPPIQRFVAEDSAAGGVLIRTLLAYVSADLNTKAAAELLSVHVNTARHRLTRIEERTGCDLRKLADVEELLIAIKLVSGPAVRTA